MRTFLLSAVLVSVCYGCQSRHKSELDRPWKQLAPAVSVFVENQTQEPLVVSDSLYLEWVTMLDTANRKTQADSVSGLKKELLLDLVQSSLADSLRHWLVNRCSGLLMLSPHHLVVQNTEMLVFLRSGVKGVELDSISLGIRSLPGIRTADYISSKEMLDRYLQNDGDTIPGFLDENSFPSSFRLRLRDEYANLKSLEALATQIKARYNYSVADVSYPRNLFPEWEGRVLIVHFDYKRRK